MSSLSLSQSRRADGSAPDRLPWSHSNCWLIREQLTVFNYNTWPCTDHTIIPVNMCSAILLFLIISHLKCTLHLKKWWITCYSKDICLLVLFLEEHPNSSKKQLCFCRCSTVLFSIILIKEKPSLKNLTYYVALKPVNTFRHCWCHSRDAAFLLDQCLSLSELFSPKVISGSISEPMQSFRIMSIFNAVLSECLKGIQHWFSPLFLAHSCSLDVL